MDSDPWLDDASDELSSEDDFYSSEDDDNDHISDEHYSYDSEANDDDTGEDEMAAVNNNSVVPNDFDANVYADAWEINVNAAPSSFPCLHPMTEFNYGEITKDSSPLDIFMQFLTPGLMENICDETNRHAAQLIETHPKAFSNRWQNAATTEMWVFFGLHLLMGIDKKPSYKDYWSKDELLHTPIYGDRMPRDRFEHILRALHFSNNESPDEDSHRLKKLGRIITDVPQLFKDYIVPGEFLCIDESLLLFKGRLAFLQYIPSKRSRFGMKMFVLVDQCSGFIIDFFLYTGKKTDISQELVTKFGYGGACILKLAEPYLNTCRKIVCDNWFTSIVLTIELLRQKTCILGTMRKNRKGVPKFETKLKKGEFEVYSKGDIVLERWQDNKEVLMVNSFMAHRMVQVASKRSATRLKPATVVKYNQTMGGCRQRRPSNGALCSRA